VGSKLLVWGGVWAQATSGRKYSSQLVELHDVNINLRTVELTITFERAYQYFIEVKTESYHRGKNGLVTQEVCLHEVTPRKMGVFKIATANAA
jgi:hypothetical protein